MSNIEVLPSTDRRLQVVEVFGPTIQGEGAMIGVPTHFIRFAGCSYRCAWCDSMHAVEPAQIQQHKKVLPPEDLVSWVESLYDDHPTHRIVEPEPSWVTLSGGDPCLQDLTHLIKLLQIDGYKIAVETQGAVDARWLTACEHVTISPKPPSSRMETDFDILDRILMRLNYAEHRMSRTFSHCLKIVIFTNDDMVYAEKVATRFPSTDMYLSVGTPTDVKGPKLEDTVLDAMRWIIKDLPLYPILHKTARVLPQLHVLLWGHELGR